MRCNSRHASRSSCVERLSRSTRCPSISATCLLAGRLVRLPPEDFLGLRMVSAFEINEGRALHTFFEMDDGSCLAFFEVPGSPFDFKRQDSLDLHIALGVEPETFDAMLEKAKAEGREVRGPVDHRFVRSIYFRDPNGYVIELTATTGEHGEIMDPAISKPHEALAHWQATKKALTAL